MYQLIEWLKSLFRTKQQEPKSQSHKETEERIRAYKRILAFRIASFERRYGSLSRRQKRFLADRLEKRIEEMRRQSQKEIKK